MLLRPPLFKSRRLSGTSKKLPFFKDRFLGGLSPRTTSGGVALPHVADANARLSIDPTGKVAGYQVIQDADSGGGAGKTYTFSGTGADVDAGLWVTGAGFVDYNGAYSYDGSFTYPQIGGSHQVDNSAGSGSWDFHSDPDYSGDTSTYAWQVAVWTAHNGSDPAPTVTRNPIASEANWTHN